MDMMSAALSWSGVALYLESHDVSLPRAVFLGCSACALNVVTHPLGAILGAVNLVIVCSLLDLSRFRFRLLLPAGVPFALVGGMWRATIRQTPAHFSARFFTHLYA